MLLDDDPDYIVMVQAVVAEADDLRDKYDKSRAIVQGNVIGEVFSGK